MTYKTVDIDISFSDFKKKINEEKTCITFHVKYLQHTDKLKLFEEMREEMKENEMWSDLERLDYDGTFPPLRYKDDKDLIDELLNYIKEGNLEMDQTEIRYLGSNRSEYYIGKENKIKMVLKYWCD